MMGALCWMGERRRLGVGVWTRTLSQHRLPLRQLGLVSHQPCRAAASVPHLGTLRLLDPTGSLPPSSGPCPSCSPTAAESPLPLPTPLPPDPCGLHSGGQPWCSQPALVALLSSPSLSSLPVHTV